MMRLGTLFPPDIRTATGDPRVERNAGPPQEEAMLSRVAPKRLREFRAGRALAREAMRALALPAAEIGSKPDRAPSWPHGIAGSISHCEDLCVVALARTCDGYASIGIDIEPAEALDPDLLADICTGPEHDWLASQPEAERAVLARTIFSAKECAYKCQYPLSGRLLDFHAMTVKLDRASSAFVARLETDAEPFRAGDHLHGRFFISVDHIVTGMALRHEQLSCMQRGVVRRCP